MHYPASAQGSQFGADLQLTIAAGWRAPFEMAHLRKAGARLGCTFRSEGDGKGRRFWAVENG
jgi:hypothetical protein